MTGATIFWLIILNFSVANKIFFLWLTLKLGQEMEKSNFRLGMNRQNNDCSTRNSPKSPLKVAKIKSNGAKFDALAFLHSAFGKHCSRKFSKSRFELWINLIISEFRQHKIKLLSLTKFNLFNQSMHYTTQFCLT